MPAFLQHRFECKNDAR